MAEAAQHRVQTAMNEFLTEIDKTKLRPIQKSMYLCNVDCMSDMSASMEEVRCHLLELKYVNSKNVFLGSKMCRKMFCPGSESSTVCPVRVRAVSVQPGKMYSDMSG